MKFVKVAYALNQTYNVEDLAISKMVKEVFAKTSGVKLLNVEVIINASSNGFKLEIKALKNKKKSYFDLTKHLQKEIEDYSINLVNTRPENIAIAMEEENEPR